MRIATATTLTNPNDNNDRFIMVKLHNSDKEYKASYINKLDLDRVEQRPNINKGTEVFVLIDEYHNILVIGSTQYAIDLPSLKRYIIKNKNEILLKTDDELNIVGYDNKRISQTTILTHKLDIENDVTNLLRTLRTILENFMTLPIVIGDDGQYDTITPELKSELTQRQVEIDSFL